MGLVGLDNLATTLPRIVGCQQGDIAGFGSLTHSPP